MEGTFEYKYEIIVKVKHQLNDKEINMIKRNFAARLEGLHTECPEQLIDADIEIKGKSVDNEKTQYTITRDMFLLWSQTNIHEQQNQTVRNSVK